LSELESIALEAFFPGNTSALADLVHVLATESPIAIAGAGVSVPLAPAWGQLLHQLVLAGVDEGFIEKSDQAALFQQITSDPLELATTLEEQYTTARFRARLAQVFDLEGKSTQNHEALSLIAQRGVVTFNYDEGISTAFARKTSNLPRIIRADDKYELTRWIHGEPFADGRLPIIHWHGSISAPDRMILTADDYNRFYGKQDNRSFIEDLWRGQRLLVVGFSFSDPFLTRIAESVLRSLETDNQHFALIGWREKGPTTALTRRTYSRKYRLTPIFYRIMEDGDGREDHSALSDILSFLLKNRQATDTAPSITKGSVLLNSSAARKETAAERAEREFRSALFATPQGTTLYAEPSLHRPAVLGGGNYENYDNRVNKVNISELVHNSNSILITAPFEYGGTTLARRLALDLCRAGQEAVVRNAPDLPNYAKALRADPVFVGDPASKCIVIDNIDLDRDERLIKEVIGLKCFDRIFLIAKRGSSSVVENGDLEFGVEFEIFALEQLAREDVRTLASQLYDTYDADLISAAVEKTYDDLLELCIPLTPANVIMYLSVLYKQGSFVPLNKLHIMDEYIREILARPSDAFADSLTVDHKIDILASFVFKMHTESAGSFSKNDWDLFANEEMERSLSTFDKDALLSDLAGSRFIVNVSGLYHFKYRLFYAYFLGQYISQRREVLDAFVSNGKHLTVDGLVEILAGLSKENTCLVTDLVNRVERAVDDFNNQYGTADLDPYAPIKWAPAADEQEKLWEPVAKRLSEGRASDTEVDKVKRSILAEQKTADQLVIIREFTAIERSASFNQSKLIVALRESRGLDAELKLRAMSAIFSAYRVVMQIGFLFSPIIASRKYFVWNNVAFVNNLVYNDDEAANSEKQTMMVAGAIPQAVADRAATEIGSRRLGDIFKHLASEGRVEDFDALINLAALVHAKPTNWEEATRNILVSKDRNALYLRYYLQTLMHQFRNEVNSNQDRLALKRLVTVIQAKRSLKKETPTPKMLKNVAQYLDKVNFFKDDGSAD